MSSPVPPGTPATRPRGWWRRNLWGLLALPPLVAGVIAVNADLLIERNLNQQPRQAIEAPVGETVAYGAASVRLVSLTEAEPTVGLVGREGTLPTGLTIWQTVFDVDPDTAESSIEGCELRIEDAQGRLYGNYPNELDGSDKGALSGLLDDRIGDLDTPEPDEADPFTSTSYFVLPTGDDPTAVRVICGTDLPRFVRFTVA